MYISIPMKRTISIALDVSKEQHKIVEELNQAFLAACNEISPIAMEKRCWNRVALHNLVYNQIRKHSPLGSQMVCNAIFAVCKAYKAKMCKEASISVVKFHQHRSLHFDKRTYSIKGEILSLYTLKGRLRIPMHRGPFQMGIFSRGDPREGELICKKGKWYFNLVIELPDPPLNGSTKRLGVDLGENVLAVVSSGKFFGGGKLRYEREKFLAKRRKLQSNGTQSAKQLLKKISGKEARRIKHMNHQVSKGDR